LYRFQTKLFLHFSESLNSSPFPQTICYRETGHDAADSNAQNNAIARFERHWLWHGSNVDVLGKILNQGFNR
jgi:hypothetical protein